MINCYFKCMLHIYERRKRSAFKLQVRKLLKEIIMRYYYECEMTIVVNTHEVEEMTPGE